MFFSDKIVFTQSDMESKVMSVQAVICTRGVKTKYHSSEDLLLFNCSASWFSC